MQQRLTAEQRWMLGSTTTMAPPAVMTEIFRVLTAMGVAWKKLGPYNLKCLYKMDKSNGGGGGGGEDAEMDTGEAPKTPERVGKGGDAAEAATRVKFEIQVYKMRDERYMVDFQRMDGGVMTCMDAAAQLMKNLQLT
jgi:5'-AMP-activated protein kinase catalytic alpha subunit